MDGGVPRRAVLGGDRRAVASREKQRAVLPRAVLADIPHHVVACGQQWHAREPARHKAVARAGRIERLGEDGLGLYIIHVGQYDVKRYDEIYC